MIAAALVVSTLAMAVANWFLMEWPFNAISIGVAPLALVGALLIFRVPRNRVGWLLGLSGVLLVLTFATNGYAWAAVIREGGRWPGGDVAAAVGGALFAPGMGFAVLMLLFFPTGRGLGGRWTWVERSVVTIVVAISVTSLFKDVPVSVASGSDVEVFFPNPLALHGPLGDIVSFVGHLGDPWTAPVVLIGPLSLFVRYRRSSATEREQIKWLAYSGTVSLALIVLSNFTSGDLSDWLWIGGIVSLGALPIAIAVAIFRYRLYDIDVIIRRTLLYASISAVLLVTYVAGVAVFEFLLAPLTGGSGVAVAISTLAVVALFQPLRKRMRDAIDRRFYRARYDADHTLDAFASRLRDQVDLAALEAELLAVVGETVQPERASVWLRDGSAAAD